MPVNRYSTTAITVAQQYSKKGADNFDKAFKQGKYATAGCNDCPFVADADGSYNCENCDLNQDMESGIHGY